MVISMDEKRGRKTRPLKIPDPPKVSKASDVATERLVNMANQTCLVALDKTLSAVRRAPVSSYAAASARVGAIAERMMRAVYEVRMCLPPGEHPSR